MVLERFAGKITLMTGATQGIGLATARRVGLEGGKLVISSRNEDNVNEAVSQLRKEGIEVYGTTCHQANGADRKKLIEFAIEKYGGFDSVFMSAGVNPHIGNLLTVTKSQFEKAFGDNVKQTFLFIRECVPLLQERGGGAIVTNGTAGANDYGMAYVGQGIRLYMLSKLTLASMVYHVSVECYNRNVRVNCVMPGTIDTPFLAGGLAHEKLTQHLTFRGIKPNDPSARIGKPSEVAGLVSFLLSEDASYLSGQSILLAGPQPGV